MSVIFVEDERVDIKGILDQCDARGIAAEVARTFCDGARALADRKKLYRIAVIDIMLPWGVDVPDSISVGPWSARQAGLYLLQGMRECSTGAAMLSMLNKSLGIPLFYGRHLMTPVVVLSKIQEAEEECRKLDILSFYTKVDFPYQALVQTILRYESGVAP